MSLSAIVKTIHFARKKRLEFILSQHGQIAVILNNIWYILSVRFNFLNLLLFTYLVLILFINAKQIFDKTALQ